jgi:hypothetical protein
MECTLLFGLVSVFLQCVFHFVIIRSVRWRCWLLAFVSMCKLYQFCFLSSVGLFLLWTLPFLDFVLIVVGYLYYPSVCFLFFLCGLWVFFSVLFCSACIFMWLSCFLPSGWMYWGWVCLFPLLCGRYLVLGCCFLCWFLDVWIGHLSFDCFPVPVRIQFPSAYCYGHWDVLCSSHI